MTGLRSVSVLTLPNHLFFAIHGWLTGALLHYRELISSFFSYVTNGAD
ncbi:hypothetical protein J7J00_11525 [Bacillus sp. ISL-4]|nr:hypothetical protein [Bacillus sp. ISL-4]MBT2666136.1 hypothetical protein [Bacillus sp. ISL-4]